MLQLDDVYMYLIFVIWSLWWTVIHTSQWILLLWTIIFARQLSSTSRPTSYFADPRTCTNSLWWQYQASSGFALYSLEYFVQNYKFSITLKLYTHLPSGNPGKKTTVGRSLSPYSLLDGHCHQYRCISLLLGSCAHWQGRQTLNHITSSTKAKTNSL